MVFFVLKSVKRRVEMFYHKLKAKNQMRNVYNIVNIGTFHSCFFHFIMNLQDVVRSKKSSFLNCIAFSTEHGGAACDLICRSILCEIWWEYRLNNNNNLTQIVINIHTNITYDKRPYFFYLLSALFNKHSMFLLRAVSAVYHIRSAFLNRYRFFNILQQHIRNSNVFQASVHVSAVLLKQCTQSEWIVHRINSIWTVLILLCMIHYNSWTSRI